jgi:Undecaprenyl-phosphate glucose phosphotransferase
MDIANIAAEAKPNPSILTFLAKVLDVTLIASAAVGASSVSMDRLTGPYMRGDFVAFSIMLALMLFPSFKVYQSWRGRSLARLAGRLAIAWFTVQACSFLLTYYLNRNAHVSLAWLAYWTGAAIGSLILSRMTAHAVLRHIRRAGRDLRKVAVVGYGVHCWNVVHNIETAQASGFRATAILDLQSEKHRGRLLVPVFIDLATFAQHVRAEGVQEVWLALPLFEESTIRRIVAEFTDYVVNIRFLPDISAFTPFQMGAIDLLGMPAINLIASPLSAQQQIVKEVFDRVFSAFALIALAPLLLIITAAVKLSSRGPVFFRQKRTGADGRVFRIYKFRTMYVHNENDGVVKQATRGDARITRVGAFLRSTSLDELPQFINVLCGEMSVVGPRPHAIEHDAMYQKVINGYIHRFLTKPGITGWAQVNGYRGETDRIEKMASRVAYDVYYVKNWSLALDIRIVAATILHGFKNTNAY